MTRSHTIATASLLANAAPAAHAAKPGHGVLTRRADSSHSRIAPCATALLLANTQLAHPT
ncbi:MAG: hypothetical protein ABJA49_16535 [Betaproteobacteria bacterium]